MESDKLKDIYENELKPELENLETDRKQAAKEVIIAGIIGIPSLLMLMGITDGFSTFPFTPTSLVVAVTSIIGVILGFKAASKYNKYRAKFKKEIVGALVNKYNPEWNFSYQSSISRGEYQASKIFRKRHNRFNGEDLIEGSIEKTNFKFSELHTEYEQRSSKKQKVYKTIFKGLFFKIEFNKELKGETYVLPDKAEKLLGKWGQKLQAGFGQNILEGGSYGELVKLENPEFEKEFVVYGGDQIEPRYILTPSLMEAIVNLKKRYYNNISLSFIGNNVYIALSVKENLFEPKLFSTGLNFKHVSKMNSAINIIEVIIHEMNLNTRIWTKV